MATVTDQEQLHPDTDGAHSDDDSLGSFRSDGSYSTSLRSSIHNYKFANGRRYKESQWLLPNDQDEQDRMDLAHHVWRLILGGDLLKFHSKVEHWGRVLDVGTGTGIWAIDMADEHSEAKVMGTDLSAIQPGWVPENCSFYVDDAETSWNFDQPFDVIHGRALNGAFTDWPAFYRRALNNLNPGGIIEMQDFQFWIFQHEDFKPLPDIIGTYLDKTKKAFSAFGKNAEVAVNHKKWLEEAGFEDVEEGIVAVPMGNWAKGKDMKQMGMYHLAQSLDAVDAYSLALFTQVLRQPEQETREELEAVKEEMSNKSNRLYGNYYCVTGRRPRAT